MNGEIIMLEKFLYTYKLIVITNNNGCCLCLNIL